VWPDKELSAQGSRASQGEESWPRRSDFQPGQEGSLDGRCSPLEPGLTLIAAFCFFFFPSSHPSKEIPPRKAPQTRTSSVKTWPAAARSAAVRARGGYNCVAGLVVPQGVGGRLFWPPREGDLTRQGPTSHCSTERHGEQREFSSSYRGAISSTRYNHEETERSIRRLEKDVSSECE
jgi:hypothetical protein